MVTKKKQCKIIHNPFAPNSLVTTLTRTCSVQPECLCGYKIIPSFVIKILSDNLFKKNVWDHWFNRRSWVGRQPHILTSSYAEQD